MLISSRQEVKQIQKQEEKGRSSKFVQLNSTNMATTTSKVLLVDDSVFNLVAVSGLFKQFGLECDTAVNGIEAI